MAKNREEQLRCWIEMLNRVNRGLAPIEWVAKILQEEFMRELLEELKDGNSHR